MWPIIINCKLISIGKNNILGFKIIKSIPEEAKGRSADNEKI